MVGEEGRGAARSDEERWLGEEVREVPIFILYISTLFNAISRTWMAW